MSRRISCRRSAERGFTLIEAVIALGLVSIMLASVGALVATNVRGAQSLSQRVAMMQTARLIASALPRGGEPLSGKRDGEVSGYRWQMRSSPFSGGPRVTESRFTPEKIELRVQSPSGAIASFETVRLQNWNPR